MKGKLIIIGGGEDKGDDKNPRDFNENGILQRVVDESVHKTKSRIEIVPSASSLSAEVAQDYIKAFGRLGAENTGVIDIESREAAHDKKNLKKLEQADVVFFSGGDQLKLTSLFGGTPFFELMEEKLRKEPFIYAGTSAGAAAVSNTMIIEGSSTNAILKGEIKTTAGLGLVENIVFDTHFIQRGRIGRLFQIIVSNPEILGVGIEEDTGLLITNSKMEAIGPGMTIILDGRSIRNTNLLDIREGVPLSIDNLTLHVMSKTDVFDLKNRELSIITPEECRA